MPSCVCGQVARDARISKKAQERAGRGRQVNKLAVHRSLMDPSFLKIARFPPHTMERAPFHTRARLLLIHVVLMTAAKSTPLGNDTTLVPSLRIGIYMQIGILVSGSDRGPALGNHSLHMCPQLLLHRSATWHNQSLICADKVFYHIRARSTRRPV